MENVYVTADTHFDHKNLVVKNYCDRPWTDLEEHNEMLVQNWNNTVTEKDTIVVVGDFAWKRPTYWLDRLNGNKILIRGNHDPKGQIKGFQFIKDMWSAQIQNQHVIFCHYQMQEWSRSYHGAWHLYGHSHGNAVESPTKLSFDVGIDVWDYKPVHWDQITEKMNDKIPVWKEFVKELRSRPRPDTRGINEQNNKKYWR